MILIINDFKKQVRSQPSQLNNLARLSLLSWPLSEKRWADQGLIRAAHSGKNFRFSRPNSDPTDNCPKTRIGSGSESFFGTENPIFRRISELRKGNLLVYEVKFGYQCKDSALIMTFYQSWVHLKWFSRENCNFIDQTWENSSVAGDFWVPEHAREVRAARVCPSLLGHPNARIAREFRA